MQLSTALRHSITCVPVATAVNNVQGVPLMVSWILQLIADPPQEAPKVGQAGGTAKGNHQQPLTLQGRRSPLFPHACHLDWLGAGLQE